MLAIQGWGFQHATALPRRSCHGSSLFGHRFWKMMSGIGGCSEPQFMIIYDIDSIYIHIYMYMYVCIYIYIHIYIDIDDMHGRFWKSKSKWRVSWISAIGIGCQHIFILSIIIFKTHIPSLYPHFINPGEDSVGQYGYIRRCSWNICLTGRTWYNMI